MSDLIENGSFWQTSLWKWLEERPQRFYLVLGTLIVILALCIASMFATGNF